MALQEMKPNCTWLVVFRHPSEKYVTIIPYAPLVLLYLLIHYTSSTAQGGGGSFKNRKPMGEIGCCESGMAERIH